MTTIGTMRALDTQRGAVRVEELYDTDLRDLWEACTSPELLARWLAYVSGDLQVGGTIEMTFTSTWTGPARIERCDAPHHLLLTTEPGTDDECQLEAWLTEEGPQSRLVVEERGLPPRPAPLPWRWLAYAPRRPRAFAPARRFRAPRRLVRHASRTRLAQPLGRTDARLRGHASGVRSHLIGPERTRSP